MTLERASFEFLPLYSPLFGVDQDGLPGSRFLESVTDPLQLVTSVDLGLPDLILGGKREHTSFMCMAQGASMERNG
jgi:hypothetical protein